VNYPLKYFAERIAGDVVDVVFPGIEGDPAYWEPTAYQDADLILLNGASYAKWVDKVSLPHAKRIDTSAAFKDRYIALYDTATHTHGPGGEHAHGDVAFTTWLDPTLAVQQAQAILEAFSHKWPDHRGLFERGFATLKKDLEALDTELGTICSENENTPLVMSHPVYHYFERRFGLNTKSVHWEPDAVPDDLMVTGLNRILAEHPAKWMVWEADPMAETVHLLNNLGVKSRTFDPCGNVPARGDYLSVMYRNAGNLKAAYTLEEVR
jgi:zinc transport system substrate-binding protein